MILKDCPQSDAEQRYPMPDSSILHFESVRPFLDWNETQMNRYELIGGRPVMQAGANRGHERIA